MVAESVLRQRLASLLSGDVSLDDFEDWFAAASWNAHKDSSPAAQRLIGAIELRLGEYSSGHLSLSELLQELEAVLRVEPVQFSFSLSATIPVSLYIDVNPAHISHRHHISTAAGSRSERRFVPVLERA